jgi:hypothetical protein
MTAKEAVMSVDQERTILEKEAELLNEMMTGEEGDENQDEVIDRLNQVSDSSALDRPTDPLTLTLISVPIGL